MKRKRKGNEERGWTLLQRPRAVRMRSYSLKRDESDSSPDAGADGGALHHKNNAGD